jgi:hypothetical protein
MGSYVGKGVEPQSLSGSDLALLDDRYLVGRNLLINGSMRVWQRGNNGALPINVYTYMADRWVGAAIGVGLSWSQGIGPSNPSYTPGSLAILGAAGNTGFNVSQRIESSNSFHTFGKKLTASLKMFVTGAPRTVYLNLRRANAKDDFTNQTQLASVPLTLSGGGAWESFEVTFSPTMPAEVANGILLMVDSTPLLAGETFAMSEVQLEVGEKATEFERVDYGTVVLQCQRYFQALTGSSAGVVVAGTTQAIIALVFMATMRADPTLVSKVNGSAVTSAGGTNAVASIAGAVATVTGMRYTLVSSGLSAGDATLHVGYILHVEAEL